MMQAAGFILAAFAVLGTPDFGAAQDADASKMERLKALEANAVQIMIGKTADEIKRALEAGPYADVHVMEIEHASTLEKTREHDAVDIKPGDLNVMFSAPEKTIFTPSSPRVSIIVGMANGVAVSIERVRTFAK